MQSAPSRLRKVYLARRFPPLVEAMIGERYQIVRNLSGNAMDADQLTNGARDCAYLFVTPMEKMSRAVFEKLAGTLEAVATLSAGFEHIDLDAAREHGVAVFHSPGVVTDATAEIAMLLLLNAARRAHEGSTLLRSGKWTGWEPTQLLGVGLAGKRMGIFGMGRIGQAIAGRARSFGLEIHYHNRRRLPAELEKAAVYHDTPEKLLAVSDSFVISALGAPELAGFLTRQRIAMLPPNSIVINIARGELIDDDALIEALAGRNIYAAGLDVFRNEPAVDTRYFKLENVFLMPHLGTATAETRNAMGFLLLHGLRAFEEGRPANNRLF